MDANEAQCWPVDYTAEKLVWLQQLKNKTCQKEKCSARGLQST